MSEAWREVLDEFDVEATATEPPDDREGDWFQLLGVFGTAGFIRLVTDGAHLVMQLAPPEGVDRLNARMESHGWTSLQDGPPALLERGFPDTDQFRDAWIAVTRLGDAIRDDDADDFLETLESGATEEPDELTEKDSQDENAQDSDEQDEEQPDPKPDPDTSGGAFEPIGLDDDREGLDDGAFEWMSERTDDGVAVVLGFGTILETADYQRLEERLVRNLRGKYDVDVEIDADHSITLRLPREPGTRAALHVLPDRGVSSASVAEVDGFVGDYFGTLEELAGSGIDPLVFLGVTASKRREKSSSFETIGRESAPSKKDDSSRTEWLVDDDEPDEPEEDSSGVVLGVTSQPDPEDPLEPGRFDDPRLRGPDATTSLVDVVLRHPGYSDRRVGQVLSILLSIEYSDSLELINKAPTVIAWGVARDRGQTMKTVVEGAGGKVYLAEPGEFHED